MLGFLAAKCPEATFVILGHSMGGSVAARACHEAKQMEEFGPKIIGLIVIDVVEGTAIDALPFMEQIVSKRPKAFRSVSDGIEWAVKSRTLHNKKSASVSIPSQLMEVVSPKGEVSYVWKTDLMASEKYWMGWFKGLTKIFLAVQCPKLLLLAGGGDRMDTELTIAQMQGKFKMVCFPDDVGHCMMEDNPKETAKNCHMLLDRFKMAMSTTDLQIQKEVGIGKFKNKIKPYV